MCVIYKNFDIVRANKTFASLFHLNIDEIIGKKCYDVWQGSLCKTSGCIMKNVLKGENYFECEFNKKLIDGTSISCIITAYPFKNADDIVVGVIETFTDITDRKKMEEEYQDAYNRMTWYQKLIAHEVNNILNNVQALVYLYSHYRDNSKKVKEKNEVIAVIKEQVKRGENLIKNIVSLSKLENSQISLKRVDILNVLEDIIKYIQSSYKNRDLIIKIDSNNKELFARVDDLLFDVFENLLNNAIKHNTNPSVEISIKITKIEKGAKNYFKLDFIDNGIGISDERKKLIFNKSNLKTAYKKGMGIGLALVSKIIKNYNGDIWIEDKIKGDYSKGSKFVILIPEA